MLIRSIPIQLLLLLTLGCGVETGSGGPPPEAKVHSNVFVVDATPGVDVTLEPDRLIFVANGHEDLLARQPGDVLVCKNAGGFLRAVVSVAEDGSSIVVATTDATLGQAIADGTATESGDLSKGEGKWEMGGKSDAILPFDGKLEIGNTTILSSPDAQVTIESAHFEFKPNVDLDLNITDSELTYFRAIADGTVDTSMVVRVVTPSAASLSQKKVLWRSAPKFFTQMIGPVPVVETVDLSIGIGTKVSTEQAVTFEGGGEVTGTLRAGATFDREVGWQAVGESSIAIIPIPIVTDVDNISLTALEVYMYAEVNLRFYNLAGPFILIGPYADLTEAPGSGWGPGVGVRSSWGGKVQVLGLSAGFQSVLFDHHEYL